MKVNWLFKNVTVIDGSGGPQFRGDVAVKGDRIVDMAPALNLPAEQVIDGQGRVLAPGFIDVLHPGDVIFQRRFFQQRGGEADLLRQQICRSGHHGGFVRNKRIGVVFHNTILLGFMLGIKLSINFN